MENTPAKTASAPVGNGTKLLVGGLIVLVIILAVANYNYMKQLKEQKPASTATASTASSSGMGSMETKTSDNAPIDKGDLNSMG